MATVYQHQGHHSSYEQCDTYFVEPAFPSRTTVPSISYNPQYAQRERERARAVARERQYAIAEAMSRDVSDEYQEDIVYHMMAMDTETLPEVESIDLQHEIEWYMRPYLLDFLIEAHTAFQLLPSTLFLTVNLLDRYCSKRIVYKKHYQLVGCAALLIAAKYGDKKDRVPTIRELKSMCCSLYNDDMFIQMEWHVLQTLGWTVGHPTVDAFLQIAVMDTPYDPEAEHLALYILEISMFHRDFVSRTSANLARSALALSRCILGRPQSDASEWASGYDSNTLVDLSQHLMRPSQVLYRKYSTQMYSRVSKLLETFLAKQASISRSSSYGHPSSSSTHSKSGGRVHNVADSADGINISTPTSGSEGDMVLDATSAAKLGYSGDMLGMVGTGLATPQKNGFANVNVESGYLTPPITPETSDAAVAAAAAQAQVHAQAQAHARTHSGAQTHVHTAANSSVNAHIGTGVSDAYVPNQHATVNATGSLDMEIDVSMKGMADAQYDAVMSSLLTGSGSSDGEAATVAARASSSHNTVSAPSTSSLTSSSSKAVTAASSSCSICPLSPAPAPNASRAARNEPQPVYQFTAGSGSVTGSTSTTASLLNHGREGGQSHGHNHHLSLPVPIQPTVSFPEYNPFAGQAANMNFGRGQTHAQVSERVQSHHQDEEQQYVGRPRQHSSTMSALGYTGF
ncbi:hypothetical protein KEM54_002318 [Ascosphaera aggregata]|nr:hypothetical protein KEM54_002318 [Ascosphaera aggregata]